VVAVEHVPDRLGGSAGEVDLGDLGAALPAEPGLHKGPSLDYWDGER
jgi:hypothetical protein